MKGYIYNGTKNIEYKELSLEACGDCDIIIKNRYSGICGSDITSYKSSGDFMRLYPGMEFGHETVSEVVEAGKNVEGISVGDRVFPYPLYAKDDTKRAGSLGGFSEYIHVPNCKLNHSVYKVSDQISDPVAAMLEPFAVGGQAAVLSCPKKGQNAIVYGAGVIGMAAAITLKYLGCAKVMLVNRSTYRLDIAKKMGFDVCSPVQQNIKETALEVFGTSYGVQGMAIDADIFIDATGADDAFTAFQQYGKLNAVFTIVGTHTRPMTFHPQTLMYASQRIQGSGGYTDQSVRLAMEIMESQIYDLEQLITQEYPLEQLEEAIVKASNSSESLKVMINFK